MASPLPGFQPAAARGGPLTERPPPRSGNDVTPLIDGTAKLKALEQALLDAQSTIEIGYWQFDPAMDSITKFALDPILHPDIPGSNIVTERPLAMLIVDALARGVEVRVIMSDFEPLFDLEAHFDAWDSYLQLLKTVAKFVTRSPAIDPVLFQMICARHPATLNPGALAPLTKTKAAADALEKDLAEFQLNAVIDKLNDLLTSMNQRDVLEKFAIMPGLWDKIEFDAGARTFKAIASPPFPLSVASHHIKLCVVDGQRALMGGMNLNGHLLVSNPTHKLTPPDFQQTHDLHVEVAGPIAHDYRRFFAGLWNASIDDFNAFLDGQNLISPGSPMSRSTIKPMTVPTSYSGPRSGSLTGQAVRTVTGPIPVPQASSSRPPLPNDLALDTRDAYRDLIDNAKQYIYIENQYFRWAPLAGRIKRAMHRNKALEVIVVLPHRTEEVGDPVTLHGNAIQFDELTKLANAFPTRFGLFTFTSPTPPRPRADTYQRSVPVYIHSKAILVDDEVALVSSANLNGRSMMVDTEIGLIWAGRSSVTKFRKTLWKHALGTGTDQGKAGEFLARWRWRALRNAFLSPDKRTGLVVEMKVSDLARGLRIDSPLNPLPSTKVLAPALYVYSATLGTDHAGRPPLKPIAVSRPNIS
ncbi:PLD-like domain-containing protein [Parasphingorhabdus marina DSM 22363]|uniref:Phospholipase D n=1 Tax=Parasphingorhabdus marina DSM 22363 TaxID=1123272 RepID=A0A1N6D296_9SPHN|nr:phospholipase D-like domain-containing protein [Parasphingorhabdus marina]SIN64849.1 PLD-like domain-containing protein [Parasphingorhabdus marina DSM 22363]